MSFGTLDRKTAILWICGVAVILILRFVVLADRSPGVVAASESVPMAEKRLERLRQIAATVPAKETLMKQATAELETREKGMLKAETGAQAQAQLQELLHKVGAANGIDIRGLEDMRPIKPFGSDYGEASLTVRFTCLIEQLVNLLAALATQPELVSTNQIQITGGPDKNKTIQVRLTLSGVVPKKLALEKKAGGAL
jgi:Type II secretion system (T2SS), protein M subtype b